MSTESEIKSNPYEGLIIVARHPCNGSVARVYVFPTVLSRQNAPEEHWRTKKKKEDEKGERGGGGSVGCLRGLVEKVEKGREEEEGGGREI